jgi:DNA repair protein RecN (Recombination protein N)
MIEDLSVRDFALIDSVSLEFGPGLNILSGETGAGKSILIGALTFLLGGKGGTDSIRTGAEEARVSGTILLERGACAARAWLAERGIEPDGDRVLIRRSIRSNGKSAAWIQDSPVTKAELADFTAELVDIHGQHDHQSLLKVGEHRRFLDAYAGIVEEVAAFTELYAALAEKRRSREEMNASERERAEKAELLSFAVTEITEARLKSDEEDELAAEEQRLSQFERLNAQIEQVSEALGHEGIVPALKRARAALETAVGIDPTLSATLARVEAAYYELEDLSAVLRRYRDGLSFDPARLEAVEERLSAIYKLKKKYGPTVADVLAHAEESARQLERLAGLEEGRATIDAEIAELERRVFRAGSAISEKRKQASAGLEKSVEGILRTLGMANARFACSLAVREGSETTQVSGPYGFDVVEFLISPNAGESAKPLARIASGGELSRVMLALKTVLAKADETGTLIFDEIDTGIGGEVALSVGSHLRELSAGKQVLCITHLASIASCADVQIKIEKTESGGKTSTGARAVSGEERVAEIARMLAGDGGSAASVQHARELLARRAAG